MLGKKKSKNNLAVTFGERKTSYGRSITTKRWDSRDRQFGRSTRGESKLSFLENQLTAVHRYGIPGGATEKRWRVQKGRVGREKKEGMMLGPPTGYDASSNTSYPKIECLKLRSLVEGVGGVAGLARGNGVALTGVRSLLFAREEVVAEKGLARHDGEVSASERGPGVDDEDDDGDEIDDLGNGGDGRETHPDVLGAEDEDNQGQETDPRAEDDGPTNVKSALLGQRFEFERLENVPQEPKTDQGTNDQNHDARDTLVEIVNNGAVGRRVIPNEQGQIQDNQQGHHHQNNGRITFGNHVRSHGPTLGNQHHQQDDRQIHQHVQQISKRLQTFHTHAVTLQGCVMDHLEEDGEKLQGNRHGDDAHDRVQRLALEQLPSAVSMRSNHE